jgi:hypothetical protein
MTTQNIFSGLSIAQAADVLVENEPNIESKSEAYRMLARAGFTTAEVHRVFTAAYESGAGDGYDVRYQAVRQVLDKEGLHTKSANGSGSSRGGWGSKNVKRGTQQTTTRERTATNALAEELGTEEDIDAMIAALMARKQKAAATVTEQEDQDSDVENEA